MSSVSALIERDDRVSFVGGNDEVFLRRRHAELLLTREPRIETDRVARRVVNRDVTHGDATRPFFVPSPHIRATARPGNDDRHAVQLVMAGVEDVTGHAQWLSNAWTSIAAIWSG